MSGVVALVGNRRPDSRTHRLGRVLADAIGTATGLPAAEPVDLAVLGAAVLDRDHPGTRAALAAVLDADVLIVASPTYKATYSGLLKAFLDQLATGALDGTPAVPLLLGGAPDHRLAVDVHLTPLLLELGASVPARGLFVVEADVDLFHETAGTWTRRHGAALLASVPRTTHH